MILHETTIDGIPAKFVTSTDDITDHNTLYFRNYSDTIYCGDIDCSACPFEGSSCISTTFLDVHDHFHALRETHPELFI